MLSLSSDLLVGFMSFSSDQDDVLRFRHLASGPNGLLAFFDGGDLFLMLGLYPGLYLF